MKMAWDEPDGNDRDKDRGVRDPWSGGRNSDGPPELDEVVRKLQEQLRRLFGTGDGKNSGSGGSGSGPQPTWAAYLPIFVLFGMLALLFLSFYNISPGERGVVTRFGRYVDTLDPGWRVRLPRPIERVEKVKADLVQTAQTKASMFSKDGNIAVIDVEVQYRIKNAKDYLFSVKAPDELLRQATEASLREIVGATPIDTVLTEGRQQIAQSTKEDLQAILDQHSSGLLVNQVNIRDAKPPEEVKEAFDDAIKAGQDYDRLVNEAEAYRNEVVPKARGASARQRAEAAAYKAQATARAEGDVNRFRQLAAQYQRAPEVTRERMYLETMESVLRSSSKVVIDSKSSNQMLYLPLDKLMQGTRPQADQPGTAPKVEEDLTTELMNSKSAAVDRERERNEQRDREKR
ncbi:MAG: FtsH protease activity modulator HflK [Gammaproteobacteria bacterium]